MRGCGLGGHTTPSSCHIHEHVTYASPCLVYVYVCQSSCINVFLQAGPPGVTSGGERLHYLLPLDPCLPARCVVAATSVKVRRLGLKSSHS